jgi:hypothetical protein
MEAVMVRRIVLGTQFLLLVMAPSAWATGGKGMTWGKARHTVGVDELGCGSCNAYVGDTACTTALPILCIKKDGSPRPSNYTPSASAYTWAAGNLATTLPVTGTLLTSLANANQMCATFFGSGWRMAEFHDGWGWGLSAFGNVRSDTRYWVYINDQPANCWNQ